MELGGRSGMHAGQKRTYRIVSVAYEPTGVSRFPQQTGLQYIHPISFLLLPPSQITETYAFLPREAVTRFLTICPECKKNLRPSSPAAGSAAELAGNESSSELDTYMNYSSHTESSLEAGPTAKRRRHSSADLKAHASLTAAATVASSSSSSQLDAIVAPAQPQPQLQAQPQPQPQPPSPIRDSAPAEVAGAATPVSVPKIRVKPQLQRPLSPPETMTANPLADPTQLQSFDMQLLKSRDNLVRYYDFMRRFYAGGSMLSQPVLAPPLYGSSLLQSLSFPTTTSSSSSSSLTSSTATTTTTATTTAKTTTDNNKQTESNQLLSSPTSTMSATQQLKQRSPASSTTARARSPIAASATPSGSQAQPHTPINLTKLPFCSSRNGQPASTSTPVSVAPLKLELPSPPKPLTDLRIPQLPLRGTAAAAEQRALPSLPPLDLEQLKPITSTYLQLTRSMGLSDEDALRFDNLVSKDFKYTL